MAGNLFVHLFILTFSLRFRVYQSEEVTGALLITVKNF